MHQYISQIQYQIGYFSNSFCLVVTLFTTYEFYKLKLKIINMTYRHDYFLLVVSMLPNFRNRYFNLFIIRYTIKIAI